MHKWNWESSSQSSYSSKKIGANSNPKKQTQFSMVFINPYRN